MAKSKPETEENIEGDLPKRTKITKKEFSLDDFKNKMNLDENVKDKDIVPMNWVRI